jgi:hypothetical protein
VQEESYLFQFLKVEEESCMDFQQATGTDDKKNQEIFYIEARLIFWHSNNLHSLSNDEDPVDVEAGYDAEHRHDGQGQNQAAVRHAPCMQP